MKTHKIFTCIIITIFLLSCQSKKNNEVKLVKKKTFEKAFSILNEYYPAWQGENHKIEVWAKKVSENKVELIGIDLTINEMELPQNKKIFLRYVIDLEGLGQILEEENVKEEDWNKSDYERIR